MTQPRSEFDSATPTLHAWLTPAEQGELHIRFVPDSLHAFMEILDRAELQRPDGQYVRFDMRVDNDGYVTLRGTVSAEPFAREVPMPERL